MKIQNDIDLKELNTLQLPCIAQEFATISSLRDLHELINLKKKIFILGGGSNIVLPSRIDGLVAHIALKGKMLIDEDDDAYYVNVAAGENWHEFVCWALDEGYYGLENLSLIPGTAGAAPIQNIGAYGVEVKDFISEVFCIDIQTGQSVQLQNKDCKFGYRDSVFKHDAKDRLIVTSVSFRLPKDHEPKLNYGDLEFQLRDMGLSTHARHISKAVIQVRKSKLPDWKDLGNAGSFFKNPIVSALKREELINLHKDLVSYPFGSDFKLAAGWLIDRAGWKGKNLGPVGMYEKQALVLVNHGGALSDDVKNLAKQVASDVFAKFGVQIEPEPIYW